MIPTDPDLAFDAPDGLASLAGVHPVALKDRSILAEPDGVLRRYSSYTSRKREPVDVTQLRRDLACRVMLEGWRRRERKKKEVRDERCG